jgi:hypothetical protein
LSGKVVPGEPAAALVERSVASYLPNSNHQKRGRAQGKGSPHITTWSYDAASNQILVVTPTTRGTLTYNAADQLINDAEALPYQGAFVPWATSLDLVVLEAMASGLACALSDADCVNETVEHATTGLLTPFEDVAAFAASVERLVHDRELREYLGQQAAQVARERFDVRNRMPLYSAACERAIHEAILPFQLPTWRQLFLEWLAQSWPPVSGAQG